MPEKQKRPANSEVRLYVLAAVLFLIAAGVFAAVLLRQPADPMETSQFKGQAAFIEGEFTVAVAHFSDALDDNPDDYNSLLGRGLSYLRLADMESARRDLQAAADLPAAQSDTRALHFLGEIALEEGRSDDAVMLFTEVIEIAETTSVKPDNAYYQRGLAYFGMGDYSAALDSYTRAITLNDGEGDYFLAQGDAYYLLGMEQQALNSYQAYASLTPPSLIDPQVASRMNRLQND